MRIISAQILGLRPLSVWLLGCRKVVNFTPSSGLNSHTSLPIYKTYVDVSDGYQPANFWSPPTSGLAARGSEDSKCDVNTPDDAQFRNATRHTI